MVVDVGLYIAHAILYDILSLITQMFVVRTLLFATFIGRLLCPFLPTF